MQVPYRYLTSGWGQDECYSTIYEPTAAENEAAAMAECHRQFRTGTMDANDAVLRGLNPTPKR